LKPIRLSVAGLHSFRELQEVDFTSLCEGGVFGIFGPTGSGKSSLLDAMTLALYGKVERASNNTQGIMNHAENELAVSLEFELQDGLGAHRYRVERSFKRSDDIRLKTSTCRLIDITDETVVLGDKMVDVNEKVEQLLGLTIDDFTRAVVLPQGKFAEFLSLKGSDRRKMLQRLFHLEQYGDQLSQQIRSRLQSFQSEYVAAEREQASLGEASKEALEKAEQRVKDLEKELVDKEKRQDMMHQEYESKKQIWQWQKERHQHQQKHEHLLKREADITSLESELDEAGQAEIIKPYLEDFVDAKATSEKLNESRKESLLALEKAKKNFEHASHDFNRIKREKEEKEPQLIIDIERYKQLKTIKAETERLHCQVTEKREDLKLTEKQIEQEKEALAKATRLLEKAIARQGELQGELKQLIVPVQERELAQDAVKLKQEIESLEKNVKEMQQEYESQYKLYESLERTTKANGENVKTSIGRLVNCFDQSEKLYSDICNREKEVDHLAQLFQKLYEGEKERLEREKISSLARELTLQLVKGQPCPVCGSSHHPLPAEAKQVITIDGETTMKQLDEALKQCQQIKQELSHDKMLLEHLSSLIHELIPDVIRDKANRDKANSSLLEFDEDSRSLDHCLELLKVAITEVKALKQDIFLLQDKSKQEKNRLEETRQKEHEGRSKLGVVKDQADSLEQKLAEQTRRLAEQHLVWTEQFPNWSVEEIDVVFKEISLKDRKSVDVREGLDKSEAYISEKEREIATLKDSINHLQITQAEKSSTIKGITEQMNEGRSKMESNVGNEDIDDLLNGTIQQLSKLRESEKVARDTFEQAQAGWSKKEKHYLSILQSFHDANERLNRVTAKWENQLANSPFDNADTVKKAFISKEEQLRLTAEINEYHDSVRNIKFEIDRLNNLLKGRELQEEEWILTQQLLEQAKQELSNIREEKGGAVISLNEIRKKHTRFLELEKELKQLREKLDQLNNLQTVFRGNAFVEFLAEEQLHEVSRLASERLHQLTHGRYAIEVDSNGGFVIRDDANGGVRRPVSTLSGGETFLTSLALALSLSTQIQLRGQYPLEFFFLDEGFGTLDHDLLDTVITSLEKLHTDRLSVGVISHVQELQARMPRKLIVAPAEPSGRGSSVEMEMM
jgi:exonuclease SbcC